MASETVVATAVPQEEWNPPMTCWVNQDRLCPSDCVAYEFISDYGYGCSILHRLTDIAEMLKKLQRY